MATKHFQPQLIDTDWRLVVHWSDPAFESEVAEVSCFEFYGQALAAWRQVDAEQREGVGRKLTGWELIDPNGFELLTRHVHLTDGGNQLRAAEPGRYVWNEQADGYQPL